MTIPTSFPRRRFITGLTASSALAILPNMSGLAQQQQYPELKPRRTSGGLEFDLSIEYQTVNFTGKTRQATTVNGSLPAPTLRWKEGQPVTLNVRNNLAVDSSIHWHGILLPTQMDGVPGLSFNGIKPGNSFRYHFTPQQSGTYWYHSHSGYQEQTGMYGAIIIEPREPLPYAYDREYEIVLSDWSDETPERVFANLKKRPHIYNINERTLSDLRHDVSEQGLGAALKSRAMWNHMRMSDSDLSDVTGLTYTFLMNGKTPADGWVGLFERGERVLLRIINAGAMTFFDVRIPGLEMTVVAADGQAVQAVSVEEFRIGPAETYDVIVKPSVEQAYTVFCQTIDRSGFARGTLTPNRNLVATLPEMDESPILTHMDMGMDHTTAGNDACSPEHAAMGHCEIPKHAAHTNTQAPTCSPEHAAMGHCEIPKHAAHTNTQAPTCSPEHAAMGHCEMPKHAEHTNTQALTCSPEHAAMGHCEIPKHAEHNNTQAPACSPEHAAMGHCEPAVPVQDFASGAIMGSGRVGYGSAKPISFDHIKRSPRVDMLAPGASYRLDDPGPGLRDNGRRVLTYAELFNLYKNNDLRDPEREIELHLTGNMSRYMWSLDGISRNRAKPINLRYGERVRITLVNNTMMSHPMHLHGLWSQLETGNGHYMPNKHTVVLQPGSKISYLVDATERGRWAYHCHLLFHMAGMFREVRVT